MDDTILALVYVFRNAVINGVNVKLLPILYLYIETLERRGYTISMYKVKDGYMLELIKGDEAYTDRKVKITKSKRARIRRVLEELSRHISSRTKDDFVRLKEYLVEKMKEIVYDILAKNEDIEDFDLYDIAYDYYTTAIPEEYRKEFVFEIENVEDAMRVVEYLDGVIDYYWYELEFDGKKMILKVKPNFFTILSNAVYRIEEAFERLP